MKGSSFIQDTDLFLFCVNILLGISFFGIITGLVGLGYMGYILRNRSNVSAEIAFGLCCSIMLVNIQGAFVLGACSDSLAETFAMTIIGYYDEFVLEIYTSQCSACINSEENIEDAVINAIHQLFAAEYTFVVLSILQVHFHFYGISNVVQQKSHASTYARTVCVCMHIIPDVCDGMRVHFVFGQPSTQ